MLSVITRGGRGVGDAVRLHWLLALMAWGVPVGLLAPACQPARSTSANLVVATSWSGPSAGALHRELLGISRDLGSVNADLRTYSPNAFADLIARPQPQGWEGQLDLLIVPNYWLGRLAERGIIGEIPLPRVVALQSRVVGQALLAASRGGQLLGFPISASVLALVYDPTRFPAPPATIDDLLAAPLPPDVLPFALDLGDPYQLAALVACFDGLQPTSDGGLIWRDEATLEVLRRLDRLWSRREAWRACRGQDLESLQLQLFAEGRLASFVAGPRLIEPLERLGRPFAVVPLPGFAGAPAPATALVSYQCAAVVRQSRWIDLGMDVASRLLDDEANDRLNHATRGLPVLGGAYQSPEAIASPATVGFLRALENGRPFPASADWQQTFEAIAVRLARIVTRPSPPPLDELSATLMGRAR